MQRQKEKVFNQYLKYMNKSDNPNIILYYDEAFCELCEHNICKATRTKTSYLTIHFRSAESTVVSLVLNTNALTIRIPYPVAENVCNKPFVMVVFLCQALHCICCINKINKRKNRCCKMYFFGDTNIVRENLDTSPSPHVIFGVQCAMNSCLLQSPGWSTLARLPHYSRDRQLH